MQAATLTTRSLIHHRMTEGLLILPLPLTPVRTPAPDTRTATKPRVRRRTEKTEILAVLARAARDPSYIALLTYDPSRALEGYRLTSPARAAIASGDLRWIEGKVGHLDARLRTWIDCRLSQEIW